MSKTRKLSSEAAEPLPPPLARQIRVDDIEDGEDYATEASKGELEAMARLLDLVALDALRFHGRFHLGGGGRLLLDGTLAAQVTQTCVVSLDPVASTIEVPVEAEFWPQARIEALAATVDEAASHGMLDWPEPIADGRIELGTLLYETLATALDPYPRREGASFAWEDGAVEESGAGGAESPFAALSRLKDR